MSNYVVPAQWENIWEPDRVKQLKKIMNSLRYVFSENDYDVSFMLAYRKTSPYISMGCRPLRKQKNGNPYSFLMAFGFFYDFYNRASAQEGWTERYVEMCIREYEKFIEGAWPINKLVDQDVVDRVMGEGIYSMPLISSTKEEDPLS